MCKSKHVVVLKYIYKNSGFGVYGIILIMHFQLLHNAELMTHMGG